MGDYENVKMLVGQRPVVQNDYLPARQLLKAVGPVDVRIPKVRDRSGGGVKFNSVLVLPFLRCSHPAVADIPGARRSYNG